MADAAKNGYSNNGVPEWLSKLGIKAGDYYQDSKPRAKRAMKSPYLSPAARVHICLGLHTMGYKQELAVKTVAGNKQVPLTPADIAAETGVLKQNIRRALLELKAAGLVDVQGSTKGEVLIYAWAVPRPEQEIENGNHAGLPFDELPESIQQLIKALRVKLPSGLVITPDYLSAVESAARDYQNAKMVLTEALKGNQAPSAYKDESNGRNIERNGTPPPPPLLQVSKAEEEDDLYLRFKASYPQGRFDAKAKTSFEGKSRAEQLRVLERLQVYLVCDRWGDEGGRWIPFAGKWLESYDLDPPAALKKRSTISDKPSWSELDDMIEQAKAKERAQKAGVE